MAMSLLLVSCRGNVTKGDDTDSLKAEQEKEEVKDQKAVIKHIKVMGYMAFVDADTNIVPEDEPQSVDEETYDEEGRLIFKEGLTATYETHYTYDQNGRLAKEVESWGGETTTTEYVYDENGNLLREYDPDQDVNTLENKYDENGVKTESYEYSRYGGDCLYHNVYTFNKDGQLIRQVQSSLDSGITETTDYEYDEKGNVYQEVVKQDGEVVNTWIYQYEGYDANGNWTTLKRTNLYYSEEMEKEVEDCYVTVREIEYW